VLKSIYAILLAFICSASALGNNEDSLAYNLYKDKIVLYSDLGYNAAPFSIKDDFQEGFKRIKFNHNLKTAMGIGIAYKWFALRIGFTLPGTLRPVSRFGDARYSNLGIKFNVKKTFWDIDVRNYAGYSIMDGYKFNDSLNVLNPNQLSPDTRAISFSVNSWHFRSENINMPAILGQKGDYKRSVGCWYFKSTLNFFGVGNEGNPLIPFELIDTTQTKSFINTVSALDLGLVPGYAYVHRKGNWQVSAFGGIGGVVQAKFYAAQEVKRGFLGLAPRIDFRFIAGYSKPKYFFWFVTDFDVKSIGYQEMKYSQTYYSIKLVGGVRLDKKPKPKRRDSKQRK